MVRERAGGSEIGSMEREVVGKRAVGSERGDMYRKVVTEGGNGIIFMSSCQLLSMFRLRLLVPAVLTGLSVRRSRVAMAAESRGGMGDKRPIGRAINLDLWRFGGDSRGDFNNLFIHQV